MTLRRAAGLLSFGIVGTLTGCGGSHSHGTVTGPPPHPPVPTATASGAGHAFYEVHEPGGPIRGTMLTIHGGGWTDRPGDARRDMTTQAAYFRSQHWRVVNIAYAQPETGAHDPPDEAPMLHDVVSFYDQVHRAFPGPVCADGDSAGGHLAAMLAVERPTLTCALANAPPLDVPLLRRETNRLGARLIDHAFGRDPGTLAAWSPARRWKPATDHTRMYVTVADNDPIVPAQQARAFAAADPEAKIVVLPGAKAGTAGSVMFVHSAVKLAAEVRLFTAQARWLDQIAPVPSKATAAATAAASDGTSCDSAVPSADWATASRADRWRLMVAGRGWQQAATPGQPLAATSGCSGSSRSQLDGLSLWAFPAGTTVPAGAEAALSYTPASGGALTTLEASFRGFLARPKEWTVGLFASSQATGPIGTQVAVCDRGHCRGLRLVPTHGGSLIAAPGGAHDPDREASPPVEHFNLPPGTRRIAWRMACGSPAGCSLAGIGATTRPRDPLGHPAILSLYRVRAR